MEPEGWILRLILCLTAFASKVISQPCNGGPCGENAVFCFDETIEGWECQCVRGFKSISTTTINCTDFDECAENVHNCGNHTRCRNAVGFYSCECLAGFGQLHAEAGLWQCSDFNECGAYPMNNCGNGTDCVNTIGGYTCQCHEGYTEPRISFGQTVCSDIDECLTNSHSCGDGTWCQNLQGSYRCNCATGYRRLSATFAQNSCKDVDECAVNPIDLCGTNSRCINTPGSFSCACNEGFVSSSGNGKNCSELLLASVPAITQALPVDFTEPPNSRGDLYIGVGVGIGAAFVVIAIFFMVAYIAGSDRKKGKQSIQHDVRSYQVDPKNQFLDCDAPIYEDIGPPALTSVTPAITELPPVHTLPFKSATVGRSRPAIRTLSASVDNKSVQNWKLVHNEINEALYAAADVDDAPIYCNTIERKKRQRPRLEPMAEELYYSPVYQSCIDLPRLGQSRPKPPVAPKMSHPDDIASTHTPKRHVMRRNRQRLWISRVYSEGDITQVGKGPAAASAATNNHPAFRRLVSEGDGIKAKKQQSSHDLMEGTILRCGDKYYILEPQERDEETGKPILFAMSKQHADEAL